MADGGSAGDELALAAHLAGVRFQAGVEEGRWRVLEHAFPKLVVEVTGRDFTGETAMVMAFRVECDGFPARAPFVERWDPAAGTRPPAPTAEQGPPGVVDALKDWNSEVTQQYGGIYRGWQRYAAVHNRWAELRPEEAWRRDRDLTFIMEKLYGLVSEQAAWLADRPAA
jgi:hypothetical protein